MSCESTPCGNEYDSSSFCFDQRAEARLVADVAADRAAHQARQSELREAAVGEVADPHDPDRGQVARATLLGVHGGQLVDEPLRQGVPGTGAADHDRRAVAHLPDGVSNPDDLGPALTACTRRRSG